MQCKDIPDLPVLDFIGRCERGEVAHSFKDRGKTVTFFPNATWFDYEPRPGNSALHAMPPGTVAELALAKIRMLKRRGLVDGCVCGCRGDFELTDKGRALVGAG
jgi:hypothetical protein